MDVAILFSGGKDSTLAIEEALARGWNIKYLLSVKPSRTDCYLFHFATAEHTKKQAKVIGLKHFLLSCDVADPNKEGDIIKNFVLKMQGKEKIDALILGGTGLQLTQIKTLQKKLMPHAIEVFAMHSGMDHDKIIESMLKKGYKIMISQIAAYGLSKEWLGKIITKENFEKLKQLSNKYGFHIGGEGGHFDTFVLDGPIFNKALDVKKFDVIMESPYSGHIIIKEEDITIKNKALKEI